MLSIGHLHIRREELVSIGWDGQLITLEVEWSEGDLPTVLGLPTRTTLRFDHLVDWCGSLAIRVSGWRAVVGSGESLLVTFALSIDA